jgi:hypothetical protein
MPTSVGSERRQPLGPEEVGLNLAEPKQMLGHIERATVQEQVAEYLDRSHVVLCERAAGRDRVPNFASRIVTVVSS